MVWKNTEPVLGGISNGSACKPWEAIISLWSLPVRACGEAGPITGTAYKGNAEQEERVQETARKMTALENVICEEGFEELSLETRAES